MQGLLRRSSRSVCRYEMRLLCLLQLLIRARTPGRDLEEYLNTNHGPGNGIYDDLCSLTRQGLSEGWVANIEVDGKKYRRSKVSLPCEENKFFSITTVFVALRFTHSSIAKLLYRYMSSDSPYRGQYHSHPYGEINCVVQIDESAELKGMSGWQGAGWTSPGAGTHHYPEVRGGALIALFFLPAGRISYAKSPGDRQPLSI